MPVELFLDVVSSTNLLGGCSPCPAGKRLITSSEIRMKSYADTAFLLAMLGERAMPAGGLPGRCEDYD